MALAVCLLLALSKPASSDDLFEKTIRPFLEKRCVQCHQTKVDEATKKVVKPKANIDLGKIKSADEFYADSELIGQLIDVLDSADMPPESEPEVPDSQREEMVASLEVALKQTLQNRKKNQARVRRLNRFQYNYTVKDLFRLNRDVFALPEKLMTRHSGYLTQDRLPDEVRASSNAMNPTPGMQAVKSFPKDLRAAHGFDNQSNQLSLSPLLLDAFLRLAVSILESPDFNENTVGIWNDFFREPDANVLADNNLLAQEITRRLKAFLTRAFRHPVEQAVVERYQAYVLQKIKSGESFTNAMKKVASAALSSPLFLFRVDTNDPQTKQFELASRISYLLWSSLPDDELLRLAGEGKLSDPKTLASTIERMFGDPRIERFLDTFPAQWMQLENVLAATPDPTKQRYFSLDSNHPASLQMLIEPLLLFDAAFVENRPIIDLVQPDFAYQSEFLRTWYTSDLKPPKVDTEKIIFTNKANDLNRKLLGKKLAETQAELKRLIDPIREKIVKRKQTAENVQPVDLKPLAAWEFEGDLKASVGGLDLQPNGNASFKDGRVTLNNSFLISKPIPVDLKEKTLEVWCLVHNLDMRGGGVMGIQGQGDFFDTIVIGERQPRHWISGSNGFARTLDFPESKPESKANELLHLVMVYQADGTTLMYRNGLPYGKPFKKGRDVFPKNQSRVLFGLRHLPPGGNRYLHVSIDRARLYDRALTPDEVVAANSGKHLVVSEKELEAEMTSKQADERFSLETKIGELEDAIKKIPANQDPNQVVRDTQNRYDNEIRGKLKDPVFRRRSIDNPRYGGVITNAAIMSMTSGPKRTHPIARGAWIIEVIFNDPPPPPPNDVPPLNEDSGDRNLTIREKFKVHRENPDCAGCHSRLDPLGFAMENFDLTGRWRDKYENGRDVDMQGTLLKRYPFNNVIDFKKAIVKEETNFATAFTRHLLRYALTRELQAGDRFVVEDIVDKTASDKHSVKAILRQIILSDLFLDQGKP